MNKLLNKLNDSSEKGMKTKIQQKTTRRQEIVRAAAAVFSKSGFTKSTIAAIAERAGIGKGTVYEYFQSKDDLFFAVFEDHWRNVAQKAMVSVKTLGQSATQRLYAMNDAIMAQWRNIIETFPLIMEFWAASATPWTRDRFKKAFQEGYSDFRQMTEALIQDGIDRGEFNPSVDADAVAAALVGTWDALYLQAWFDAEFNPAQTSRRFLSVLIAGMTAPSKGRA
jgi:AcrR family transcriptional regulator